jgi:uncharacterized membrane protein
MRKIAIKYGLWMFIGFTLYFTIMHLLGLSETVEARLFNGVVHLSLLYLAIKEYSEADETASTSQYVRGVVVGMYSSFIGVLGFTIFMIIFLSFNDSFMLALKDHFAIGRYLNPLTASLFIFVEGIAVGLIGSYIITRVLESNLVSTKTNNANV